MKRSSIFKTATAILACCLAWPAAAQISGDTVKIGVLTDLGGVFSDTAGKGSIIAAQLAIADFGGTVRGKKIELVTADHQLKPDIASTIARRWYDAEGVDMIVDVPGSNIALAVQEVARSRKKLLIVQGVAADVFSGESCSETGIQWLFTGYTNAQALGRGAIERGGKSWYFFTIDTEGGTGIQDPLAKVLVEAGGKVAGVTRFAPATTDFSSMLLQAQATGAQVFAIASAGSSVINLIKQGGEFRVLAKGAQFLTPFLYITEVHAIGAEAAQGTILVDPFYWDLNDQTRAWGRRYFEAMGKMPNTPHAGVYTSILHYLKTIDKIGSDDGAAVAKAMREMPVNDFMTKDGKVRADGFVERERRLFQVKRPAESKADWDLYALLRTFEASETSPPVKASRCPLLK